jgi:hypothetical protein
MTRIINLIVTSYSTSANGRPFLMSEQGSINGGYLLVADSEDRQERRAERGRSDERQDRRDCRQDES